MKFNLIKEFAKNNDIVLNDRQISQFEMFGDLLVEKNKVMNLTAIEEPEAVEIKHMIDSIIGAGIINELGPKEFCMLDVGCGAGFPGIPLKICYPENRFVLLDSLNKRINFVNEVISALSLENAAGVAARAEDFKERETFDYVTSRAVARMNVLLEYCLPFVKGGGYCMLYKSGEFAEEIEEAKTAMNILGGELSDIRTFDLPKKNGSRSLVLIKKVKETPEKYPRRAGKPVKSPLK